MNIKQLLLDKKCNYFQHPKSPAKVYVEIERNHSGIPTFFITHYETRSTRERIDDRSHYDKQTHDDWKVLSQDQVDTIKGVKKANTMPIIPQASNAKVKMETVKKTIVVSEIEPSPISDGNKAIEVIEVIKPKE